MADITASGSAPPAYAELPALAEAVRIILNLTAAGQGEVMDINLPLDARLQASLNKVAEELPELKLNQLVEAKITLVDSPNQAVTVTIGERNLLLQNPARMPVQVGQTLQLQVVKLAPTAELRLVAVSQPNRNEFLPVAGASNGGVFKLPTAPANLGAATSANPASSATSSPSATLAAGAGGAVPASAPANSNPAASVTAVVVKADAGRLTLQLLPAANPASPMPPSPTPTPLLSPSPSFSPPLSGNPTASPPNPRADLITLTDKQWTWSQPASSTGNAPTSVSAPPAPGQTVALQIVKSADGPMVALSPRGVDTEALIAAAYKQLLPMQIPPAQFAGHLARLVTTDFAGANVGETLKRAALNLLAAIPPRAALLEPAPLRQAIRGSGLFMESDWFGGPHPPPDQTPPPEDFKLKLSKFVALLQRELAEQTALPAAEREPLSETLQKAQGGLAKLTLDQLNSLPRDDATKQVWFLELPFFNADQADSLRLCIERDQTGGSEEHKDAWTVSISLSPPLIGTIHCKISCYDGSVNTRFWSESPRTVELIDSRLPELRQQFEQKGLTPGFMDAQQGRPAQPQPPALPPQTLLSEKV